MFVQALGYSCSFCGVLAPKTSSHPSNYLNETTQGQHKQLKAPAHQQNQKEKNT